MYARQVGELHPHLRAGNREDRQRKLGAVPTQIVFQNIEREGWPFCIESVVHDVRCRVHYKLFVFAQFVDSWLEPRSNSCHLGPASSRTTTASATAATYTVDLIIFHAIVVVVFEHLFVFKLVAKWILVLHRLLGWVRVVTVQI
jgi:hypothetical protein